MTLFPTLFEAIRGQMRPDARLYAVLDAARDPRLFERAVESRLERQSLYSGRLGALLDNVAPHLVSVDRASRFLERLGACWQRHVGILIESTASFRELRKHVRKFLMVKDEAGRKYRFRF